MKTIKILGGGIAGLTAAINLRKGGFPVEIHEKKAYCGKHTNDFQFLENWTLKKDSLQILKLMNINMDFYYSPQYAVDIYSPNLNLFQGQSKKVLMYIIERGPRKNSLDTSLSKQAKKAGVKIITKSKLKESEADIIAKGEHKPKVTGTGYVFPLKYPDKSIVILDSTLSSKYYSYFICHKNQGEIVCVNPINRKDMKKRLDKTVSTFEKLLEIKINKQKFFAASVSYACPESAQKGDQLFVGEAAEFQDNLAGFGMMYAFQSGFLAAKAIIENKNYDKLWKKEFLKKLKISEKNRSIFNTLSDEDFNKYISIVNEHFLVKLIINKNIKRIMKIMYTNKLSHKILQFFKK